MTTDHRERIEQLYLEMYDLLMAYARSSLKNEPLAEEAVQETFRIACQKYKELLSSPNPRGWIRNTLKNVIRNERHRCDNANRLLAAYIEEHGNESSFSEDEVSLETKYGDIALTDQFRLIYEMAVDKKSHLEMARERGISVEACKKRVQRAKEFLQKKI